MTFDLTAALVDIPHNYYNFICWVTTNLCTVLIVIGGTYHIYTTTQWLIEDKDRYKTSKFRRRATNYKPVYLSFVMLLNAFIFMLVTIHMTYTETFETSLMQCHIVKYTATVFYTSFKAVLYTILVLRLWQTFSDKILVDYSWKWLCCWMFVVYGWTLMTNTINALTTKIRVNGRGVCDNEWSVLFLVSVATLDILAAVFYSYLFVKPILILIRNKEMNAGNLKLKRTAVKQCILSMVASGSTLFAAAFVFTFHMTQVFASLDVVISCFSVILMYKWHRNLWHTLGCGLCVRKCILTKKERAIDRMMTEKSRRHTFTSTTDTITGADLPRQSTTTGARLSTKSIHNESCQSSNGLSLGRAVMMDEFHPVQSLSPLAPPALNTTISAESVEEEHGDHDDGTQTVDLLDVPSDSNDIDEHHRIGSLSASAGVAGFVPTAVPELEPVVEDDNDMSHATDNGVVESVEITIDPVGSTVSGAGGTNEDRKP